jgi:hypothetical protein
MCKFFVYCFIYQIYNSLRLSVIRLSNLEQSNIFLIMLILCDTLEIQVYDRPYIRLCQ